MFKCKGLICLWLLTAVTLFIVSLTSLRAQPMGEAALPTSNVVTKDKFGLRVFIAVPKGQPPAGGWPLLVVLDGNKIFPVATSLQPKAVVVGIGYPTDDTREIVRRRYYDLTTKAADYFIPGRDRGRKPDTGGEAKFRARLFHSILPDLRRTLPINPKNITLYGHSLGGLFVINTLLTSDAERVVNYCAADPSIWWNRHQAMKDLVTFNKANVGKAKLLIDVASKKVAKTGLSERDQQAIEQLRAGPNGVDVAIYLSEEKDFQTNYRVYAQESHGTLIGPSLKHCIATFLDKPLTPDNIKKEHTYENK